MTSFEFIVLGLATWRVSNLLVDEKGPWDLFLKMRKLAGIEHDEDGTAILIPDGFMPGVLSCVWCASIWVGAFWGMFYFLTPEIAIVCGEIFGLSTVAVIVNRISD